MKSSLWFFNTILSWLSVSSLSSTSQCGNILTEKQFFITSQNYPLPYPPNKECFYLFKGGNCTTNFNIEFIHFDLTNSLGCVKDRLEIGSQDALCGTKNGSKVYKSENGHLKLKFVSSATENINRGFKLLVTQVEGCNSGGAHDFQEVDTEANFDTTTQSTQFDWTTKDIAIKPPAGNHPPTPKPCCQNNEFSSRTIILVSPNFPYSTNTQTDCTYVIKRMNSLVCRLRINILYFALGPPTQNTCPYGHLAIDGKFICGCNADLQLTTDFQGAESKILRFYSAGYRINGESGFVLEIIQDECQKRYSPQDGIMAEKTRNRQYDEDKFTDIKWSLNTQINQLKLIHENSYYLPPENNHLSRQQSGVYKHFYFFAPEDEDISYWPLQKTNQEKEETNYVEISSIDTLLTNFYNYGQCMKWNLNQFFLIQRRFGKNLNQICKSASQENINDQNNCEVFYAASGTLFSPGYPVRYTTNENICYRFQIPPGYCSLQIYFNDFQVEASYDCLKDYLAINQNRYCGNYLNNEQVTVNTRGKSYQDVNFISDADYCGRGFSAMYRLTACEFPDENSVMPDNCSPGRRKNDDDYLRKCQKVISNKYFKIKNEGTENGCTYDVTRFSENICKVQLLFVQFSLPCEVESITINDRIFCGYKTGQRLIFDMPVSIIYKRENRYGFEASSQFLIHGEQIACDQHTPDPVRLMAFSHSNIVPISNRLLDKTISDAYPDLCGLIKKNITTQDLPRRICEFLTSQQNSTECNITKVMFLDDISATQAGANLRKIGLFSEDSENVTYEEIECEMI